MATVKCVVKGLLYLDNLLKVGGVSVNYLGESQVQFEILSWTWNEAWSVDTPCHHPFSGPGPRELCAPGFAAF